MKHKIVAFRLDGTREGVIISALTQSPRGTRVLLGSREVKEDRKDKEAFVPAVEAAILELIDSSQ